MRAAVFHRFGGPEVVHVEDVPVPDPKPDEVLIRVMASTVSIADYRMRSRDLPKGLGMLAPVMLGIRSPRHPVLGMDAAGVVAAVGSDVTGLHEGDEVIAMMGSSFGGHAEFACASGSVAIAEKPANLSFDDAVALVFGGHTAIAFLDRSPVGAGTRVLVNGASGAVGSAAVQLAAARGAEVTGVCSAANAEFVASLGAARVIDYATTDFAAEKGAYDVMLDCVGNAPIQRVHESMAPGGVLHPVVADLRTMLSGARRGRRAGVRVTRSDLRLEEGDLAAVARLAAQGRIRPVVDSRFDLDDVAAAHARVATGRKRGNVVLSIARD